MMASRNLMLCLLAVYLVIAAVAWYEREWARLLYWVSAAGILTAVLWMR